MKRGRPRHNDILTPREWEVLALLADRRTNPEIAAALGITLDGAKYHVSQILHKLGVHSREEAGRLYRTHRPEQRSVLAPLGLERLLANPVAVVLSAAVVVAAVGALGAWVLIGNGASGSNRAMPADTQAIGLDLPPEELKGASSQPAPTLQNTILLTKGTPANTGSGAATIAAMQRVSSVAELQAALHDGIRVVVVDKSAVEEARGSSVLYEQLVAGRTLVGLNVTNNQLRELSQYVRYLTGIVQGNGGTFPSQFPVLREPTRPAEGTFSVLFSSQEVGGNGVTYSLGVEGLQRYFSEDQFAPLIGSLNAGRLPELPDKLQKVRDFLPERISVNRGMGCASFDEEKVAAVALRELTKAYGEVETPNISVNYCNPGDAPGQIVLGVLIIPPAPTDLFVPCAPSLATPTASTCTPQPRTDVRGTSPQVRVTVSASEITP
jgi:DNA-binding CsgD family transcriptional regulator